MKRSSTAFCLLVSRSLGSDVALTPGLHLSLQCLSFFPKKPVEWSLRTISNVFFLLAAVKRLVVCEELERSSCGNILFYGHLRPPGVSVNSVSVLAQSDILSCVLLGSALIALHHNLSLCLRCILHSLVQLGPGWPSVAVLGF